MGRGPGSSGERHRELWEDAQEALGETQGTLGRGTGSSGKRLNELWGKVQGALGETQGILGRGTGSPGNRPKVLWEDAQGALQTCTESLKLTIEPLTTTQGSLGKAQEALENKLCDSPNASWDSSRVPHVFPITQMCRSTNQCISLVGWLMSDPPLETNTQSENLN